ncbi:RIP metalloprotease RseP [Phenylobacterium sp.]|uniref:RIP metalloprotease RseP n=1 Tax=Phenylobacterium sp. TaxID=1871053 RepID=UPI002735515D|nr:RIP metalloprotease RseP [Phenylobacterium sp.]MDP3660588.1 RIP metalloprotease RseP [Phenylobacterium sp.]
MIDFIGSALSYIGPFLLVLGLVVTIHEFGHFLAARSLGIAVDRFSIGFGRAIATWKDKAGVEWRIGWLPLGGYVRFAGDENAASVPDQADLSAMRSEIERREGVEAVGRYFHFRPLWQRAVVVAGGPFANFGLSIVLFAFLLMTVGETILPARVDGVIPGSAAERAGFSRGDLVVEANGRKIKSFLELQQMVSMRANVPMSFVVERGGRELTLHATPERKTIVARIGGEQKVGALGLRGLEQPGDRVVKRYNPLEALGGGVARTWDVLESTVYYLGRLITGKETAEQLGGPLRIAQASGQVAQAGAEGGTTPFAMVLGGLVALLGLTAVLSVGIGFMNLLPVPVLDGGHLLFYAYEAITRRPLAAKVQAAGYRVGLALLLGLMLFATWNDLQQLRVFKFLGGLLS